MVRMKLHALLLGCCLSVGVAFGATVRSEPWGQTSEGEPVQLFTLTNGQAVLRLTNFGARLLTLQVPDREGNSTNVLVGPERPEEVKGLMAVAGATIGRYAGRIAGGDLPLEGKRYKLDANSHGNTLHGGTRGFQARVWTAETGNDSVSMTLVSQAGDMGFPGTLTAHVTFALLHTGNSYEVRITYRATTTAPTVVNFTNHAFFHLGDNPKEPVLDDRAVIDASRSLEVDQGGIPTGTETPVAGTPLDFREPRALGDGIKPPGYDSTLVLDHPGLGQLAARVHDPSSGRTLTIYTTEPAIQLFLLSVPNVRPSFCLEPQHFPDSPHHAEFPRTELVPGQRFSSVTRYVFSVDSTQASAR